MTCAASPASPLGGCATSTSPEIPKAQRRAAATAFNEEFTAYLDALGVVEEFEAKYPGVVARMQAKETAEKVAEAALPPAEEAKPPAPPTVDEPLRGSNMQETVFNAAKEIPLGVVFEPSRPVDILRDKAPMAVSVYGIDEKKARDTLGRLSKDPKRGIERCKVGTRGPHGHPPKFRRFDPEERATDRPLAVVAAEADAEAAGEAPEKRYTFDVRPRT